MAITNYPNGFAYGLSVRGVPILNTYAGNIFWLDSGIGSDGNRGKTKEKPFATLDYAVSQCTASNGDIIVVAPGHAETITTATACAIDVAGVSVIGLGVGNLRPIFTVGTAATATITMSAANCSMENVIIKSNLDGLNTALTVTGANCYVDIEHQDASATVEADIAIAATGDNFVCKLRDIGFAGGDQRDQSITLAGVDNARIDIDFYGKVGTAVVDMITTACTDVEVRGTMYVSGTTDGSKNVVDTITGSTWYMEVQDAAAGAKYTGGSGAAVASDDVSAVNTVLGTIASAAATGAVTSTDVAMAYIKQLVTQVGIEADTDPVSAVLSGAGGITTWKSAAEAATGISMSEVLRYISDVQSTKIVSKAYADLTGYDTAAAFTVTGDVLVNVWGVVGVTGITSTSGTTTLALGTTESTGSIIAASTVNGTQFAATDVWVDSTPSDDSESLAERRVVIGGGADIILTRSADDLTAGTLTLYCEWKPLSSGATVVAA